MSKDLISLHFNNTDCIGKPTAATIIKVPVCKEAQLPFVKTFCGSFENAQKVFNELHPGKPLFQSTFYHDKKCKKEVYSAISLADRECHFFGSIHPGHKNPDGNHWKFDIDDELDNQNDDESDTKTFMAYKGGKHNLKVYLDKKECAKSSDFKMKVSDKCQKVSHGKVEMYGTLSFVEVETPFMDNVTLLALIGLIVIGVLAMVKFFNKSKMDSRGKYQPVMI